MEFRKVILPDALEMKLIVNTPKRALNKAFLKQRPLRSQINLFKQELIAVLDHTDQSESEEFHKNLVSTFLKNAIYHDENFINTKGTQDLVIHNGKDNKSTVGVIIEAKRPNNKTDWFTADKPNSKALHELVLYYLRERIEENNIDVKYIIATNINEWYIIEASYFEKLFYKNKQFVKQYEEWRDGKKVTKDTGLFYNEIAKPYIEQLDEEIPCTYFNIQSYDKALRNEDLDDDKSLIALFKILSPHHLLKVPFANDSNELDEGFYKELLHIIGLEEVKDGSKYIIRRKHDKKSNASLLEMAIRKLKTKGIHKISDPKMFGDTKDEQQFNIALELCITWINRILFLKLLEGQLISYHKGDKSHRFLNKEMIHDFDELFKLFHNVLAVNLSERDREIQTKYKNVPYLNSSLFEISELEDLTICIDSLDNSDILEFSSPSILNAKKSNSGGLTTLDYLFKFLDSFDFSSEGSEDIQDDNKSLINASVLGKVFEKINGYKDGSIFTPGFITMYMCRESIRLAVLQKFNDEKNWAVNSFDELYNKIDDISEANKIINSIKICDPAVGSGHFLVSALNEIIAIKSELKILSDRGGKRLKEYAVEVENDELYITDEDGELFRYIPKIKESQRIQETLFLEKQTIIENCLFGVDINPNSVKICRLRLWIELLKNAYYREDTNYNELETLPNIDINIKCGNSLLSRFPLDSDLSRALKKTNYTLTQYRDYVNSYKNEKDRDAKRKLQEFINNIKSDFRTEIFNNDPKVVRLRKLENELHALVNQGGLFENDSKHAIHQREKQKKLQDEINKLSAVIEEIKTNAIFKNAFEWRFEFPEILNNKGDFEGFNLVIGNPPYIKEYENRDAFNGLRDLECYQGKMDLWYLFADLGLKLLKPNSHLCFIATNNWVTNAGASKLRDIVIGKSRIFSLIDFGAYMIFENAAIQTMIMLLNNNTVVDDYSFDYRRLDGSALQKSDALSLLDKIVNKNVILLSPIINRVDFKGKYLTFNADNNSDILNKLKQKQNFFIREKQDSKLKLKSELGQGIVAPQDFVNKASENKLNGKFKNGDGIFVLSSEELNDKKFSDREKEIIKPYFTTDQLTKYWGSSENSHWIIYTKSDINKPDKKTSKIPLSNYPKIKQHLDNFKNVITSDFAPYGLHRAREQHFFEGEKIMALRKCPNEPIFTYTDFDCYVSQAFYIIQSDRINLKYLTGLLNSKLVAFWLRNKGKMQGNAFQMDKVPLLEIPIFKPSDSDATKIGNLVDEVILKKRQGKDSSVLENKIDKIIYDLYELTNDEVTIVNQSFSAN